MTRNKSKKGDNEELLQEDIAHTGNVVGSEGELKPVDQGVPPEEMPMLQDSVSVDIPESAIIDEEEEGSKGKKKKGGRKASIEATKQSKELSQLREKIQCGFCGNPMTMTVNMHVIEIKGKKPPKDLDGEYRWTSPGVGEGKVSGVICDSCARAAGDPAIQKQDGSGPYVDLKYGIAEYPDGTVRMIPVNAL